MATPQNRQGQRLPGTIFGSQKKRRAIEEMETCFYSPTYTAKLLAEDGVSTIIVPANVAMGPLGWSVQFDFTGGSGGGFTGGARYFNGVGAPGAATLPAATTFISTTTMTPPAGADFYWDITNATSPNLWVCVTAGDSTTSVWYNLTGC